MIHWIIEEGTEQAIPKIHGVLEAYPGRTLLKEEALNWLGYHFLYWWGRKDEALDVFRLNTEIYPESANTFDSLGEANAVMGNLEEAIRSYQKSLELNPNNQNAKQALERLEKQTKK